LLVGEGCAVFGEGAEEYFDESHLLNMLTGRSVWNPRSPIARDRGHPQHTLSGAANMRLCEKWDAQVCGV
jgi:hypothetical protein